MSIQGNLPSNLTLYSRPATSIVNKWDDFDDSDGDNIINRIDVCPTYISDAKNSKTKQTGKKWATTYGPSSQSALGYQKGPEIAPVILDIPNTPDFTKNTRIVGLEHRDKGGRAYKIVTEYKGINYYFDLREDSLLDIIINAGILKDGIIPCDTVWGRVGTQMKLIRVGSKLHTALIGANDFDSLPVYKNSLLKPGDVFEGKCGNKEMFLGWYTLTNIETKRDYSYSGGWSRQPKLVVKKHQKDIKVQVWMHYYENPNGSYQEFCRYGMKIVKSSNHKKLVGNFSFDPKWADKHIKETLAEAIKHKTNTSNTYADSGLETLCYNSKMLTMRPVGQPCPFYKEYDEFPEFKTLIF